MPMAAEYAALGSAPQRRELVFDGTPQVEERSPGGQGELISSAVHLYTHVPQVIQEAIGIKFPRCETLQALSNIPA